MNRDVLIIGIAIVAGFAAGAAGSWVAGSSVAALPPETMMEEVRNASPWPLDSASPGHSGSASSGQLSMRLTGTVSVQELAARQVELAAELAQVQAELEDLTLNLANRVQSSMRSQARARVDTFRSDFMGRGSERQQKRLIDAGFSEQQASTLIGRQEDTAMERLYLRDQAAREGWLDTERYQEELAKLPNVNESIRADLSDTDYDKYLYATRQRNRVMVTSVLQGSPAQSAGVQPGDVVYSMDGQRVFENDDILKISSQGNAGEAVSVEVLRDGEIVQLYVPRGPLGVNSMPQVADPVTNATQFGRAGFGGRAMRGRGTF